jgi:excinuclease ABC subunit C
METEERLHRVPSSPGIYIMKTAKEKALYVGKAKNLRKRLRSYFRSPSSLDARISRMVDEMSDFDYIVTRNELEALVLEANYIKRLKPKYNIILRDDKNYPFLKLSVNEQWPRLEVVRKTEDNGSLYFGPYVPSGTLREILRFIRKNFLLRSCRYNLDKPMRPCVQYQMKRCLAPCSALYRRRSHQEVYNETVREVTLFLQGEKRELLSYLRDQMKHLSDNLKFEEAAQIRDRLMMIQKAWESQRVITPDLGNMDVIGLYRSKDCASIYILFLRNGMVVGQKDFFLKNTGEIETGELITSFLEQFYAKDMPLPPRIIIPVKTELTALRQWLNDRLGKPVRMSPARGKDEKKIFAMAEENAYYSFSRHRDVKTDETVLAVRDVLKLKTVPIRICAIDISNISGAEPTGALVVWEDGRFIKDEYRIFTIRTVKGANDFAMIGEVVGRYFRKITEEVKPEQMSRRHPDHLPDLLLIDGGKGQLMSAIASIKPFELHIEIAAIAKAKGTEKRTASSVRNDGKLPDRVFLPGKRESIRLEPAQPSTHLLQRIRNEAHRFAIRHHKGLRSRRTLASPLEQVRGIGKRRRLLLLRHYGSISSIKNASLDELASLKGMNRKVAEDLKRSLAK